MTGDTGSGTHLGNLPLLEDRGGTKLRDLRASRQNLAQLDAYFDTSRYLTDHSDVVALTVLEHQTSLHNLVTRVGYKVRTVLSRDSGSAKSGAIRSWEDLTANDHKQLQQMMEPLVRAMFLQDAAPFEDHMPAAVALPSGSRRLGPHDSRGRSLRELDLGKRLFSYPLSFEIYSDHFDALPGLRARLHLLAHRGDPAGARQDRDFGFAVGRGSPGHNRNTHRHQAGAGRTPGRRASLPVRPVDGRRGVSPPGAIAGWGRACGHGHGREINDS